MVKNGNFTLLLLHLVVKNGNWQIYPLVLMSSGHECQFHIATDISWSRMAIGRFAGRSNPSVLTSSGQEWQFHIATDI